MLDITFRNIKGTGYLTFKGELVSSSKEDIISALMIALSNSEYVFVDLNGVSGFDDSIVQILCSFTKKAKDLRKSLIFNTTLLTDEIKQTLKPLLFTGSFPVMGLYTKKHLRDDQYSFLTGF